MEDLEELEAEDCLKKKKRKIENIIIKFWREREWKAVRIEEQQ